MTSEKRDTVFDYRGLRLLIGIIALSLPFVVSIVASKPLTSISASYYTEARDEFVGMLFIVGAFLWAYNGFSTKQARASKAASVAAIFVALFPTVCQISEPGCNVAGPGITSTIHFTAAAVLFLILAGFCFMPFRFDTKGQGGKKGVRSRIYFVCGSVMLASIAVIVVAKLFVDNQIVEELRIVYWSEATALCAYGVAWIVAGKYFNFLTDPEEKLKLIE